MAKRATKVLPARKEPDAAFDDDSLLVRSAESLGRVIGSLQRQVHGSSRRLASLTDDTIEALPNIPRLDDIFGSPAPARKRKGTRNSASRKGATARKTSARKVSAARKGTAKRKSAAAKKR